MRARNPRLARAAGVAALWVLLLLQTLDGGAAFAAPSETLEASESLASATLTLPGGETRSYSRFEVGTRAGYVFCGQGTVRVLSRAQLPPGARAARYGFSLSVDGNPRPLELSYQSALRPGAAFSEALAAAALRRSEVELARGCHTLHLKLERSTAPSVAVTVRFEPEPATRRPWSAAALEGGRGVTLEVGESRTAYRRIEAGGAVLLEVQGPAWIRLLARSASWDEPPGAQLSIHRRRGGRDVLARSYSLINRPSRRARVSGAPRLRVGAASEVVLRADRGASSFVIEGDPEIGMLLRAQIAPSDPDAADPGRVRSAWGTQARLATYYDSNILRYSDKFIQRFEDGRDPDRFRVESLDDTIQRADLDVSRSFAGVAGRLASVDASVSYRAYARNDIKDWASWSLGWRQELGRGRSVEATALGASDFYVRHIRDSDLVGRGGEDPFQAFEFRRSGARLRYRHDWGASSRLRYDLGWTRFRHSDAFREFDSDNFSLGARLDQQRTSRLRLSYGLELTESDARGFDEPGETLLTSDDSDPSYRQLDLMVASRYVLGGFGNQVLFFQAEAGLRDYATSKPFNLAPFHSGRQDDFLRLYGSWQIDLSARYRLTVFAQGRRRTSSLPPDQLDIGVEKDFEQVEGGVRLTARF
ncbi:MAG: hypothetical protein AAF725_12700 [Acidobacteriota bacterium]